MIEIRDLSFSYPSGESPALKDFSLSVPEGSLFGLLGPNGSGNTTLLSILSGLLPVPSGKVKIGGLELNSRLREIQSFTALVPQEYAFYPTLSVNENLKFFAGVQGIPGKNRAARIAEVLGVAGLESTGSKRLERFSGGMKRRLNLAIGLLNKPRLLFLDEPTVGIDPQSRNFILQAIKRIRKQGCTVIYTSHYMEEVEAICDELGVLDNGRLLARGSMQELLGQAHGGALQIQLGLNLDARQKKAFGALKGLQFSGRSLKMAQCSPKNFQTLMKRLEQQKIPVSRLAYGQHNLEGLFLQLTKRKLRD